MPRTDINEEEFLACARYGLMLDYEGIEFSVRAGLGRNEWVVTIHFPDASEPLARSSVVKVTGTRNEAIALTRDRILNWRKRQKLKARATT